MNTIVRNVGSFSRRDLLKGGGALIIGFNLGAGELARAAVGGPPDPELIDSWIAVNADTTATIIFGKCELGQGNTTGMLQIAGEELDLDMSQLSAVRLDTHVTPDQGATTSSSSIERGGPRLRAAAAEARQVLLGLAAKRLNAPLAALTVAKGVVSAPGGESIKYGDLLSEEPLHLRFTGSAPQKPVSQYKLVGTRVPRRDVPDKVAAKYTHMQHVRVANMLHGRIVRPRGQGAYGTGARPIAVDESSIANIPARVLRKGDFIGVVAAREWDAVRAARALKVTWQESASLPGDAKLHEAMRAAPTTDTVVVDKGNLADGFARAAHVASATYHLPYQAHVPFGPNCALADVSPDGVLVMSSTQDIYNSRRMLADTLGLPPEKVRVQYYEGSGTFGHSCYEDAAQAAALMSQLAGVPVRVQFMRHDEHGWDNYGPAHVAEVRAGVDRDGRIVAYEYQGWQHGWHVIESSQELAQLTKPRERTSGSNSITVNPVSTGAMYAIANRRVISHAVSMQGLLKGSPLRSPMDMHYSFASEQIIDELAHALGIDPLEFRRRNIAGERWLGVLNAAAAAAGWTPRLAGSVRQDGDIVTGRGIAIGTHHVSFGAAVAEIEVNKRTGVIVAKKLYGALDAGLAVNPALIENQIVGMMVQATSRILKEEVKFSERGVTSLDWESYPVLRFAEHPDVTPVVVQRLNEPSTGAGEEVMGSTGAAIANAFFDATGVRLRQYPMTPERVLAALAG
jgi:CO/xanthine dehydrogenase Mo-binding subunit